jgi:hypothetical protein
VFEFFFSIWFVLVGAIIVNIIARLFLGPQQGPGGEVHHSPVRQFLRPKCGAFTHDFTQGRDTFTCRKGSNHLGPHEGFDQAGNWARWEFRPIENGDQELVYLKRGSP